MGKKTLRIWLIAEGEGLPIQKNAHLMRVGTTAEYLSGQGHTVLWWSSTFIHGEKRYLFDKTKKIRINSNYELLLLHSKISYKKNISLKRIIYHEVLAQQFKKNLRKIDKPDIILCSWPTSQFAREAVSYGEKNNVPVILDARDMWPDIFIRAFPDNIEKIAQIALLPLKASAASTFKRAYGITAMIDSLLTWACNYAKRKPGEKDRTIYIGNNRLDISQSESALLKSKWAKMGISEETWNICFFGTFGSHIALDTVIKAVKELSEKYQDIRLLIGGGGDREDEFKTIAKGCENILFLGWLNNKEMTSLMRISKCGALCIKNTFDFKDTFNTKAIQYISEGLPIVNSLSGFAKTLIKNETMGVSYEFDDVYDCKDKILYLYGHEDERKHMSENAQKCFYEKFESSVVNKQMEEYLTSIRDMFVAQEKEGK